jgi:N-acetylglucosamine malate deacetylase 1
MSWLSLIQRILVVAAHPDDEVLGCGGLMARAIAGGAQVSVLILSGVTNSRGAPPVAIDETGDALRMLGVRDYRLVGLPDNRMDTLPLLSLIQEVEKERSFRPELVLTHSGSDLNIDHRLVHQATITAFRPEGLDTPRLLSFEVPSSTEWQDTSIAQFRADCYVDISLFIEKKLSAIKCYTSELREPPHPRSLDGIATRARMRGYEVGLAAAESFQLVRDVV